MTGTPSAAVIVELMNRMSLALRMVNPFGADICTFSKTTFVMQLSGSPQIMPADFWLVAFKFVTRILR